MVLAKMCKFGPFSARVSGVNGGKNRHFFKKWYFTASSRVVRVGFLRDLPPPGTYVAPRARSRIHFGGP